MKAQELQKMLDSAEMNGEIKIPHGEYEGNFTVSVPCTVYGNGALLLCDRGTALTINAPDVGINDLLIEHLTPRIGTALCSSCKGTKLNNVTVSG